VKKRDRSITDGRAAAAENWTMEAATVPAELDGMRLDAAAARLFERHSRSRLQAWIAQGQLRVNSRVVTVTRQRLRQHDELRLRVPAPVSSPDAAQKLSLEVIYEDDSIIVLNKPAGMTVHPGAGRPDGTLLNALLHRYPQVRTLPRGGLVHRLDKDTSGLLVVALSAQAHTALTEAMEQRRIRREYDTVVLGVLPAGGTVRAPVGRHPRDRTKMTVLPTGRPAVTHYRVVERFSDHTQLTVKLETGRTHQIRVHMSYIRHPVLGDPVYGGRVQRGAGLPDRLRTILANFPRQALHARELELTHPVTGKVLSFNVPAPADMQNLLDELRKHGRA
jgi:23S rRNA pseudouridine1911/1915/1917 synthase